MESRSFHTSGIVFLHCSTTVAAERFAPRGLLSRRLGRVNCKSQPGFCLGNRVVLACCSALADVSNERETARKLGKNGERLMAVVATTSQAIAALSEARHITHEDAVLPEIAT